MKFLDLFSGIGGFRLAFEKAGHECIGYVEINKFARQAYEAIYDTEGEWTRHDITKVTNEEWQDLQGSVDVICGGFPCQSFSFAGNRRGFEDIRGTMFFEIARATEQIQPQFLLLENVKGLLNHESGNTFRTILSTLDELGYDAEWQVLNSQDFGVPQNRERVFIVGHSRKYSRREIFPIKGTNTAVAEKLENLILDDQGRKNKQHALKSICPTLRSEMHGNIPKVVMPILTPDRINARSSGRRFKENGKPMYTLTTQDGHGVILRLGRGFNQGGTSPIAPTLTSSGWHRNNYLLDEFQIRKLTPKETWRLQAFPDWAFEKAKAAGISDKQLYRLAGNSVTVNVVYEIARRMSTMINDHSG